MASKKGVDTLGEGFTQIQKFGIFENRKFLQILKPSTFFTRTIFDDFITILVKKWVFDTALEITLFLRELL